MNLLHKGFIILSFSLYASFIAAIPNTWLGDSHHRLSLYILADVLKKYGLFLPMPYVCSIIAGMLFIAYGYNLNARLENPEKESRFATWFDILYFKYKKKIDYNKGIILGKRGSKFLFNDSPKSGLLIAPAGKGKTSGFIIPIMFTCKNSIVCHDPKGEIFEKTQEQRSNFSDILVFSPEDEKSCVFNVFSKELLPKDTSKLIDYVTQAIEILIERKPNEYGNTEFFNSRAKIALYVLTCYQIIKKGETSLPKVRELYTSDRADVIFKAILNDESTPDWLKRDCNDILNDTYSHEQWSGVTGVLSNSLEVFRSPNVINATDGKSDIIPSNLRKLERPLTVYIIVPPASQDKLSKLVALVFNSLANNLIAEMPSDLDHSVTLLIDEFPLLGKLNKLVKLPTISRHYKVNALYVAQDIGQIEETYGKLSTRVLLNNCAYKIVLGQNDLETSKLISDMIGTKVIEKKTISKGNRLSISSSKQDKALISAQEILNLSDKKCLILLEGSYNRPILANVPYWHSNQRLVSWLD
ncbi:MAG: type IV secretory system conjugative DNA transfer family protein [Sphingobacteriia bacterium]|nr:type IV secretory system conjugative DNA transfer family protein [Sphingobacteriia bacterium]